MSAHFMERHNYPAVIHAMADGLCTIDTVAERIGLSYNRTYLRIKVLIKANVVSVARHARGGKKALYQLCVPVEQALEATVVRGPSTDPWAPCELAQAWPMPVELRA